MKNKKQTMLKVNILLAIIAVFIYVCIFIDGYVDKTFINPPKKVTIIGEAPKIIIEDEIIEIEISEDIEEEYAYLEIEPKEETFEDKVKTMVEDICMQYTNVDPYIVRSIIFYESSYDQIGRASCRERVLRLV